MRVAIVHYHLSPGGVTSVITAAFGELAAASIPHVILAGPSASPPPPHLPVRLIDGLGYSASSSIDPGALLLRLRQAAREALGGPPDLWHFHNHSLGKNTRFPSLVSLLASQNEALLLQIHDLAEDGRPSNYPLIAGHPHLYPVAPRIRYAFINRHDRQIFVDAGLPSSAALHLPNPPPLPDSNLPPSPQTSPLLLAPIRGIRRKNLGELVLIASCLENGARIAITRAPENPVARAIHDRWKDLARQRSLPIEFEVAGRFPPAPGENPDFPDWLRHATHFITTSVAEGFGLTWLEAAALRKPLIGRNLPRVTADHAFPTGTLYDRILIPSASIDRAELDTHLLFTLGKTLGLYRRPLTSRYFGQTRASLLHGDHLDFANLPESLQRQILLHPPSDLRIQSGDVIQPASLWLRNALRQPISSQSPPIPLQSLPTVYSRLLEESPVSPPTHLHSSSILDAYLTPGQFHFLLAAPVSPRRIRAFIFDIHGTLLISPPGAIKPDPAIDSTLRQIILQHGFDPPTSPSASLHHAVLRSHRASPHPYPEVDLRELLREILHLPPETDTTPLVQAIEDAWHPSQPMPGAARILRDIAAAGFPLGILSNAQANTLPTLNRLLEGIALLFHPDLTFLSYRHRIAKPSAELFSHLARNLALLHIEPGETLFIGNDPLQDIAPAAAQGFQTALFTGHPLSLRPGQADPGFVLHSLDDLRLFLA